jgi:hypothetical protein
MGVILGKYVRIYSGSTSTPIIAAAKACTISKKSDVMEKASSSNAKAKEFIAGRTEWEISINHLVMAENGREFQGIIKVGNDFDISVMVGSIRKYGHVICTQADISGSVGGIASGSVKLKGTGELRDTAG